MKLHLTGQINLLKQMIQDFVKNCENSTISGNKSYVIEDDQEDNIESFARLACYKSWQKPLIKQAFDTRKFNSETDRNPRSNLQHYNRSEEFVNDIDQKNIERIAKLIEPLKQIEQDYGKQPEYQESYARILRDKVEQTLVLKAEQRDIFQPQIEYLKELLFLRYRLSSEDLDNMSTAQLKTAILKKDENLLKKGVAYTINKSDSQLIKNTDNIQESIVNAIFGNHNIRRDGEKSAKRTITITIHDSVE